MVNAMEFRGRLRRADGCPADAGVYGLVFGLHASPDDAGALWEEELRDVHVGTDGEYDVVLGVGNALRAFHFDGSIRYLSVRTVRAGRREAEMSDRVPVIALAITVAEETRRLADRLGAVEAKASDAGENRRRVRILRRRIRRLEAGDGPTAALSARIAALEARLARLDGLEGRVVRLEDELEDIVGPDGDIVDLDERVAALEKGGRKARAPG